MDRSATFAGLFVVALSLGLAACQPSNPPADPPKVSSSPPQDATPPPAVPGPAEAPPPATQPRTASMAPAPAMAMPAADPPPGTLYYCAVGEVRVPVEYDTRVDQLCRRHPQMGPCRYERDACRARGGRVFTARDEEVTLAVEAEYDRVVRRVRFQADGGPSPR